MPAAGRGGKSRWHKERAPATSYNALGQRAELTISGTEVEYLYGAAGEEFGVYNGANGLWWHQEIPGAGRRLGRYTYLGTAFYTRFYHTTGLGSVGVETDGVGNVLGEQLYYPQGESWQAAGNVTNDGLYTYTWDAEGRLATAVGGAYTFQYDGDGWKVYQNTGTLYWRAVDGADLAETDLNGNTAEEYIYFAGRRIAQRDAASGNVFYYFPDQLGSTRTMTDANGNVCYDADFYPFGGERAVTNNCAGQAYQQQKFAGMEYDPPAGYNYYTDFRIYAQNLGRWLSPDPLAGDVTNPQSLNRYAYVLNNPTNFTDLLGLCGGREDPCPHHTFQDVPYGGCSFGTGVSCAIVSSQLQQEQAAYELGLMQTYLAHQGYQTQVGPDGELQFWKPGDTITTTTTDEYGNVTTTSTTTLGQWVSYSDMDAYTGGVLKLRMIGFGFSIAKGPAEGAWWGTLGLMTLPVTGPALIHTAVTGFVGAGIIESAHPGCLGEFLAGFSPGPSSASTPCYAAGSGLSHVYDWVNGN